MFVNGVPLTRTTNNILLVAKLATLALLQPIIGSLSSASSSFIGRHKRFTTPITSMMSRQFSNFFNLAKYYFCSMASRGDFSCNFCFKIILLSDGSHVGSRLRVISWCVIAHVLKTTWVSTDRSDDLLKSIWLLPRSYWDGSTYHHATSIRYSMGENGPIFYCICIGNRTLNKLSCT